MASPSVPARDPSVNHFDNGTVEQQIARACQVAADYATAHVNRTAGTLRRLYGTKIDSPLEAAFMVWWCVVDEAVTAEGDEPLVQPFPQYHVGRYRLDFALLPAKVAVELDGHDFHEKTPSQVTARNRRDRALEDAGWRVFHFSGSEFLSEPVRCVAEARSAAADAVRDGKTARIARDTAADKA